MSEVTSNESVATVRTLLRKGRYDEAIALLESEAAAKPDCPTTLLNLATACFAANQLDKAKTYFEQLTRLRPADVNAYVNLGAVLNRAKDYRGAIEALRRGLQRDRRSAAAYYNMGIAHRGTGNRAMAVTAYRDALDCDPDMVDAHLNLANVLLDMGNHQQAVLHYNEALRRKPSFAKAQRGLAKAEQKAAEARTAFSPFGRLVASRKPVPKATPKEATGSTTAAKMNPEERAADRRALFDTTAVLASACNELAEGVRDRLEVALVRLNKTVAQGEAGAHLVSERHEEFVEALAAVQDARGSLLRGVKLLVRHEKEIAERS